MLPQSLLPPIAFLLAAVSIAVNSVSVADYCGSSECNFTSLYSGLSQTLTAATATADQGIDNEAAGTVAANFASSLSALNLLLRPQLDSAARCAKRWLSRSGPAECRGVCCPDPTLGDLIPAMECLKSEVKLGITAAASVASTALPQSYNYEDVAFDTYNVFSGAFMDFVRQLAINTDRARQELQSFGVFYARLTLLPERLNVTLLPRNHSQCVRIGPLWRNMLGVALQQLVMHQIASAGDITNGDSESTWKAYLNVAEIATRTTITCSAASVRNGPQSGSVEGDNEKEAHVLQSTNVTLAVLLPIVLLLIIALIIIVCWRRRRNRRGHNLAKLLVTSSQTAREDKQNNESTEKVTDGKDDSSNDYRDEDERDADCQVDRASRSSADGADLSIRRPDGTVITDPDEV